MGEFHVGKSRKLVGGLLREGKGGMKLEKGIGIVESFDAKVFFCCFSTSDLLANSLD